MNVALKKQVLELSLADKLELIDELEHILIKESDSIQKLWLEECER